MTLSIKKNIKFLVVSVLSICILVGCLKEFDYGKSKNAVKTQEFRNVLQTEAIITGTVITDNGSSLTERGICYNTSSNPTVDNFKKVNTESTLGDFSCILDGLLPGTTYYARAYAKNSFGTAYGVEISFTTLAATVPIIPTTTAATLITASTAKTGGVITNSGASNITSRGVCYSSSITFPTIAQSKTLDGTGIGTFISSLNGLSPNVTYYMRAYATNSIGTGYGDVKTFNTSAATIPNVITTTSLISVTQTTATCGGNITDDGGTAITSRGVCWSNTTSSPTIVNQKTIDGFGIGSYTSLITGLMPGITYYVRSYATNSIGTAYGTARFFTTSAATIPIGVITTSISSITQTTASTGGSITNDGGSLISRRGVCWSNSISTPTISNSNTNNGTGIGAFASSLTGLIANSTYFVRAYAINGIGATYGNVISFTTTTPTLTVGQSYQGGIIGYILQFGDLGYISGETHGLIATTSNLSTGAQWGCSGISISTSTTLGTGQNNTTGIVNNCATTNIAAHICVNLNFGGYTDWFLPSRDELNKLYLNRTSIGGFSSGAYWSSSQNASTTAWYINFNSGTLTISSKTSSFYVRGVRRF